MTDRNNDSSKVATPMSHAASTNARGDAHSQALLRSRKRAALRAWNDAVAKWRAAGEPHGDDERDSYDHWPWRLAAYQQYGARVVYDIETPAFVAEGK